MAIVATGATSLGHTLLHIAALSLSDDQPLCPEIYLQHQREMLGSQPLPYTPPNHRTHKVLLPLCEETPEDEEDAHKQAEMVLWLLGSRTHVFRLVFVRPFKFTCL